MGFEILNGTIKSKFFIQKENTREAFDVLKRKVLSLDELSGWITISEVKTASGLIELLNALRWIPKIDSADNIVDIYHDGFKVAEEEILFKTIAPYVREHSFIEYIREGYSTDFKIRFNFNGAHVNISTWSKHYNEQINQDEFVLIEE